jgi:hypothetical protein
MSTRNWLKKADRGGVILSKLSEGWGFPRGWGRAGELPVLGRCLRCGRSVEIGGDADAQEYGHGLGGWLWMCKDGDGLAGCGAWMGSRAGMSLMRVGLGEPGYLVFSVSVGVLVVMDRDEVLG